MKRIVIAASADSGREILTRLLNGAGYEIFRACASGGEVRRAVNQAGDCLVILYGAMPDCLVDELAWDIQPDAQILLLARPELLIRCEFPRLFKLEAPCPGSALTAAVDMLTQMQKMQMPRRDGRDKEILEKAKKLLMQQKGLNEPEAHRMMQQYAMNHGVKMADYAAQILRSSKDEDSESASR
ncbi:MAG: ANTAR domain-containing protein [Clostridia bacterium]|nr:ANTAR domain-containing protein [Clostridia bacterium]